MVGLPLSSSHGVGDGDAELQSTPTKYVALADLSPLTLSVDAVSVQLPPKGPGSERLTDEVGRGAAVLGGCVGAGVLVGVGGRRGSVWSWRPPGCTSVVELPPHARQRRR